MKHFADYIAHLTRLLRRKGRTEQDAEDLVQEAFIRLQMYQRDHDVLEPKAFLVRTVLNLSIDNYRHDQSHPSNQLTDEMVVIDTTPGPDEVFAARQRLDRLSTGLHELSPRTRDIFLAHRMEGQSYIQIAAHHAISLSAVEKHIAKAVLFLTEWMTDS